MAKKPAKKVTSKQPVKKKTSRHQFRGSYKLRCIYSFSESIVYLNQANSEIKKKDCDNAKVGLALVSCYRSVAHSLEMLCKHSLDTISPYLTLQELKLFDDLKRLQISEEFTCVGRVALARGSKIIKLKLSDAEVYLLHRFIEKRNECEHREINIKNLKNAIKEIVPAQHLIIKIFNKEFRDGDLLDSCNELNEEYDIEEMFESLQLENSEAFEKIFKKIGRLRKANHQIITCANCFYETAVIDSTGKKYNCEMCEDQRMLISCSSQGCKTEVWVHENDKPYCQFHLVYSGIDENYPSVFYGNNSTGMTMTTFKFSEPPNPWAAIGQYSYNDFLKRLKLPTPEVEQDNSSKESSGSEKEKK